MRFLMDKGEAFCSNNILIKMDFVLTLDLILVKGNEDSCEQVFFHNQTPDYWYVFEICGDTTWNITKNWAGNFIKLASGSENISPMGNTIHIAILTMGAQAAVYLNEEPVAYFNDLDFNASGKTLFMCSAGTSPTVCEFDNIKFWTL